jgi:flavin reductase (DIM6/NTAB) family NADH-FMN oxidoreductase RutF
VPSESPVQIVPAELASRDRYQLITSLVVPRPIAWASTWNEAGGTNLAPFSYFAVLSSSPALVGISVGARRDGPKDTLVNARATGAVCVNVVTEAQLEAMNRTSAEVGPDVDEFDLADLEGLPSPRVDAPYVARCPAVLECELRDEVDLPGSRNVLLVLEVVGVILDPRLLPEGGYRVAPDLLQPVGRMGGSGYMLPAAFRDLERP